MPDDPRYRYRQVISELEAENRDHVNESMSADYVLATELYKAWGRIVQRQAPHVFPNIASRRKRFIRDWYFFFQELGRDECWSWNTWREQNPEAVLDLTEFAPIIGRPGAVELYHGNFSYADFSGISLTYADCRNANFTGAKLNGTLCEFTNFENANLSQASFRSTDLRQANLRGACLDETDFDKALTKDTNWSKVDLSKAKNLHTVKHLGPSTVDIDSIYMSRGRIPLPFLRGCGVPELFITYIDSLLEHPVQFYSCFISYSTADQEFAERLYADLQNKGVRCWFAPHHVKSGKSYISKLMKQSVFTTACC